MSAACGIGCPPTLPRSLVQKDRWVNATPKSPEVTESESDFMI